MILRKQIFIFAILSLALGCSNTNSEESSGEIMAENTAIQDESPKSKTTKIGGTLEGGSTQAVTLELLKANSIEPVSIDTTSEKGEFQFEFEISVPSFYRIGTSQQNVCVLIVYPGDNIKVNAQAESIYTTYRVEGSKESERLRKLNGILVQRDSISMAVQQAQINQNKQAFDQALAAYNGIMQNVGVQIKQFIDEDPGTLSALAAAQNLDINQDFPYFKKVVEALDGKADGNEFYEMIRTQVQQESKLAVGSEAPEIALNQPDGTELKLSDLRGQYVLIDFWASWCGPCRRENPNVKRVYDKYHDQGFEIYGVSLDKNKQAWVNAIKQDGLQWQHVSDLKYWQSSVVPEYSIKGIPLTYLIDPEGKIVAKNLRGASLEQKLAEIFTN